MNDIQIDSEDEAELLRYIRDRQNRSRTPRHVFIPLNEYWTLVRYGDGIARGLVRRGLLRMSMYYRLIPYYSLSETAWKILESETV